MRSMVRSGLADRNEAFCGTPLESLEWKPIVTIDPGWGGFESGFFTETVIR
jgi:hypothetical protein